MGDRSETLHVRLLGAVDLRLGETPLPPLESARAESLLASLLLHRETPQPRGRLAFLLWPDSTEPQARTNLRHLLHTLRRALPDADRFLVVGPRTLGWRADAPYRLDVATFEDALARAEGAPAEGVATALRDAVDAYGGDLVPGSYEDWLLEERDRLRGLHLAALERLCGLLEAQGEHAEAVAHAERLVRDDPLREDAYRLLMRLHDARGDRARALRAYHACVEALGTKLGIEPSAETREAYEALLPGPPGEAAAGTGRGRGRHLVGRAAERKLLTALWRETEAGRARLVLVTGEAGIGKTRLVEELRAWCAGRGAATAEARSYAVEGELALAPVVEWLRAEPLATRRGRLDRRRRTEVERVLGAEVEPAAAARSEAEQRQRLFDALAAAVHAVGRPLLLVADDLHWADRESLGFLHYLLRSNPEAPLLVVATARLEEIGPAHPLAELRAALHAQERIVELEVPRLTREETGVLAELETGRLLAADERDRLYADTGGNPLFAVEALRVGPTAGGGLSPRVHAVIGARLDALTPPARELADVAAAVGREFPAQLVAAAATLDEETFAGALDELWRRRIVRERGADAYDFSHEKLREAAYDRLGAPLRRRHHLRIARALEGGAVGTAPAAAQLAFHLDRGGAAVEAARQYRRAGEDALRIHATAEARRLLERGLSLLETVPSSRERDELELELLTVLLPPLSVVEGAVAPAALEAQARALALSAALDLEPSPPVLRWAGIAALAQGRFEDARAAGIGLQAKGERDGETTLLVESSYVLGVAAFWRGRFLEARRRFEAAAAAYRPDEAATHVLRYGMDPKVVCVSRLANTLGYLGKTEAALRARDVALAHAAEVAHDGSTATALVFAALLSFELGDHETLRRDVEALAAAAGDLRPNNVALSAFRGYLAVVDRRRGEGFATLDAALADARRLESAPGTQATVLRLSLEACAVAGEPERGLAAAELAAAPIPGAGVWEAETARLRAGFRAVLGAPQDEVVGELVHALAVARRQRARLFERRLESELARVRAASGSILRSS